MPKGGRPLRAVPLKQWASTLTDSVVEPPPSNLVIPDTVCFEVTEVGRTIRLDFRRRTLKERVAMWRRRYGL